MHSRQTARIGHSGGAQRSRSVRALPLDITFRLEACHIFKVFLGARPPSAKVGIGAGEIRALCRENGAAKSMLGNIVACTYPRTSADLVIDGAARRGLLLELVPPSLALIVVSSEVPKALTQAGRIVVMVARRAKPRDACPSGMIAAEMDAERLEYKHICSLMMIVFGSTYETMAIGLSFTLHWRAHHARASDPIAHDGALIPTAVVEFLRSDSPLQVFGRNAPRDTEMHGRRMLVGDFVSLAFGAAAELGMDCHTSARVRP